jgi:UDP-N-acetylmuramoylalanine--D-glutamate ligase
MKKLTILGIGRSGIAAAKLAKANGLQPFVSDFGARENLLEGITELEKQGIAYECGGHSEKIYNADALILSPGIKKELPIVQKFSQLGIPILSEIEFAAGFSKQAMIFITGSNGKTTTTSLLGRMLESQFGARRIAGNIGIPLSDVVSKEDSYPLAVELSSFQLETIERLKPALTIWLNVSPNHLDWYNSYKDYIAAKARVNKNNSDETVVIYNADDSIVSEHAHKARGKKESFSLQGENAKAFANEQGIFIYKKLFIKRSELKFSGPHHLMNMMAAILAALNMGVEKDRIYKVLREFNGLEHRMEIVRIYQGVTYINDTKSTSIEALKMALLSFDKKVILIAGGKHKGASYTPLAELIREKTKQVFLIGAAAEIMEKEWKNASSLENVQTLQVAVAKAEQLAKDGDVVILSPACSSFDQFEHFEKRGEAFKHLVNGL